MRRDLRGLASCRPAALEASAAALPGCSLSRGRLALVARGEDGLNETVLELPGLEPKFTDCVVI